MDIDNLNTFCVVANYKSFIKAAEILNVTQSAITRRIQSLENELSVPLFNRTPQSVALTKQGKDFLTYAERMLQIYHEGKRIIAKGRKEEKLMIAAPPAVSMTFLPEILNEFYHEHCIRVSVNTVASHLIFDMLIDKTINVGLTSDAFTSSLLDYELVFREEVVCVGHPEFVKQYILGNEITKYPIPIILNNMNVAPWNTINEHFLDNPLFEIVMEAFYVHVIEKLARMGVGLATLPISLVNEELKKGELVKVCLPNIVLPAKSIYMATNKNVVMEPIHRFKNTVRRVLSNCSFS